MRITTSARIQNQTWRFDPDTGFLKCTASILRPGVMTYLRDEVADANPPEGLEHVRLYVSPSEIAMPDGIATLEGMPATVGHIWQTAGSSGSVGNISGTPAIQGEHLIADILLTDPAAVRRVMLPEGDPEKLVEISSAGDWSIIWETGQTEDGQPYDGYFVKLRYNHVALLPAGAGRAGASVRIINTKEVSNMSDQLTRLLLRGRAIRVHNEDVAKMEEAMGEAESEVKNAVTPEQLQAALDELTALKAEVGDKNARISELQGMVQSYKDQLDAALAPDAVEEAAAEMAEEREEAAAVMNSHGLKLEGDDKKLRGHDLRVKVVNSVRVKNGKPEFSAEEAKDEGFIKGVYKVHAEMAGTTKQQTVTGAAVVDIQNSKAQNQPNLADSRTRFEKMYGGKK